MPEKELADNRAKIHHQFLMLSFWSITPIALNIVALSPVFGGYITISLRRQKGPFSREAYQALLKLPTSAAI
ncbi:MAG TPA: hypothetical protein VNE63_14185, partial [Candidatus Acidoferrales bacterium]|nr:hypothetical protein [Candidatus Acidoferrales bacterium]